MHLGIKRLFYGYNYIRNCSINSSKVRFLALYIFISQRILLLNLLFFVFVRKKACMLELIEGKFVHNQKHVKNREFRSFPNIFMQLKQLKIQYFVNFFELFVWNPNGRTEGFEHLLNVLSVFCVVLWLSFKTKKCLKTTAQVKAFTGCIIRFLHSNLTVGVFHVKLM